MKVIKETICTKYDERGRVIKQTRTVDIEEVSTDFGYDFATRYNKCEGPHYSSFNRIKDAYDDYCRSKEW